jgi:hypothetical protein
MFKGVSQCISQWVYFTLVHSTTSISLPHPFTSHPPFSITFNTHPYILYLHRCYVLRYCWCSITLFSFPYFLVHRVVPRLQTCSTSEFLCICLSLGSIFHVWEKTCGLCFFNFGHWLHRLWSGISLQLFLMVNDVRFLFMSLLSFIKCMLKYLSY